MARARRAAAVAGALLWVMLALTACAKKGPPTGGPPDIESPRLIASSPDSGAERVARGATIALTFSEGMEPRSTGDAVSLAPRVDIKQRHWNGRTLTLVLAESLKAHQTYAVFVARGARDEHGNPFTGSATVVFTTADTFPRGLLEGDLEARGFAASGTHMWCYDAGAGRAPDSTARDFDAIGVVDDQGQFRVVGLPVPGRYRLWVFADLNHNRSFEPDIDVLAPVDTVLALSADAPVARGLRVRVSNPRAPGVVKGAVLDSLGGEKGPLHVMAVADTDSTRRLTAVADDQGRYQLELRAGRWRLRAWRDISRDHEWQRDREPASAEREVSVEPAAELADINFVLERPADRR